MDYVMITGDIDEGGRFINSWWIPPNPNEILESAHEAPTGWEAVALNDAGEIITRAVATLTDARRCGGNVRSHLTAVLSVPEGTRTVELRHRNRAVVSRTVPEPTTVRLDDGVLDRRPQRGRTGFPIQIDGPAPGPGAYAVAYWQAPHSPISPLGVTEPGPDKNPSLEVDLTTVAGGDDCRLIVVYFDGIRSCQVTSSALSLSERRAQPSIVGIAPATRIFEDTSLTLTGRLGGDGDPEAMEWSVDGKPVGRGPTAGVYGLTVGRHTVQVRHGDDVDNVDIDVIATPVQAPADAVWDPPWRAPHRFS